MTTGAQHPARRTPQQDRSRAMVDRILTAGREILLERGYERTSTSRIAKRAGISPGSLYQYFPDKEAILAQVLDRYVEQVHRRITDAFMANLTAADPVRRTIASLLDALEVEAPLLRVVYEQLPRTINRQRADFVRRVEDLVATALLFQDTPTTRPTAPIAWILVRTIEAVTVGYVLDPSPISRDTVIDELTRLVTGYVGQGASSA
ncbi:TetR/AcrR family transcriptional regulator [Streptomyces sp. V3I7]|uniref:TetR/AcrR family transcriptional regulator n=1 Tax=Streptomyces sp. V3I7 TaxID=3042278 RepID=UPI00278A7D8A|nr:TetR family transcriptional regulator [Streptomyces sp. V3I7]MDQ0993568.1 AcrR family transcriptional regulator [Streptomyces sp. V3I7]